MRRSRLIHRSCPSKMCYFSTLNGFSTYEIEHSSHRFSRALDLPMLFEAWAWIDIVFYNVPATLRSIQHVRAQIKTLQSLDLQF